MKPWICGVFVIAFAVSPATGREWTDDTGTRHVEAAFVSRHGDNVYFRMADGKARRCAWVRLSMKDRAFIEQLDSGEQVVAIEGEQDSAATTRRCAYIGCFGSFHLTGSSGTAAYGLSTGSQYIAELSPTGQKNDFYWLYRPSNGDPFTTHWAIGRRPDCCGKYPIWRFVNNSWIPYEKVRGWGEDLDGVRRTSVVVELAQRYDDSIVADQIKGCAGINAVKLSEAIKAAMRTKDVGLAVDDVAALSEIKGNEVIITARPRQHDNNTQIRHRIIATIEGNGQQVSFTISSQGSSGGQSFRVNRALQARLFQALKRALNR